MCGLCCECFFGSLIVWTDVQKLIVIDDCDSVSVKPPISPENVALKPLILRKIDRCLQRVAHDF